MNLQGFANVCGSYVIAIRGRGKTRKRTKEYQDAALDAKPELVMRQQVWVPVGSGIALNTRQTAADGPTVCSVSVQTPTVG